MERWTILATVRINDMIEDPKAQICKNCENNKDGHCSFLNRQLSQDEIKNEFAKKCEMFSCTCWKLSFNEVHIRQARLWFEANSIKYPQFFNLISPFEKDISVAYSLFKKNNRKFDPNILKDLI